MGTSSWLTRAFKKSPKGGKTSGVGDGRELSGGASVGGVDAATAALASASVTSEGPSGLIATTGSPPPAVAAMDGSVEGRKMCVEDFEPLKLIGRGAFGTCFLR